MFNQKTHMLPYLCLQKVKFSHDHVWLDKFQQSQYFQVEHKNFISTFRNCVLDILDIVCCGCAEKWIHESIYKFEINVDNEESLLINASAN